MKTIKSHLYRIKRNLKKRLYKTLVSSVPRITYPGIYSQYSQDRYVYELFFSNKKGGIFIDVGANDGITFSNTYFFEKELGWKGLAIEPLPGTYEKLSKNRNCITLNCGVSDVTGTTNFLEIQGKLETLSGIVEKIEPIHMSRIDNELKAIGGAKKIIEIQCFKLNELIHKYHFPKIDFLSIDTEGGELDILKSIDYNQNDIKVITVENNYKDVDFQLFMRRKGYKLEALTGSDEIYRKLE